MPPRPTQKLSDALDPAASNGTLGGTKSRLLDAAERLYAERGFDGMSVRAVTQLAEASVSAANYHFGSKEALVLSALIRRLGPINDQRIGLLDALEAEAGDAPPRLESVVDAFLRPTFEALTRDSADAPNNRLLAARLHADPAERMSELKTEIFGPVAERYVEAFARTLPQSDVADLQLGLRFVVGVLLHVVGGPGLLHSNGADGADKGPPLSEEGVLDRMVTFAAAGLHSLAARGAPDERTHQMNEIESDS